MRFSRASRRKEGGSAHPEQSPKISPDKSDQPRTDSPSRDALCRIAVLSIFPELVDHYLSESVIGRSRQLGILDIAVHDLRAATADARRTIDDTPFGGGAGMVFRPEPVFQAVEQFDPPRPIYLLSPGGERFTQQFAAHLAHDVGAFSLLCGRYEGIDQRVSEHLCDGEISIGDFVLAGGELAALTVIEAVCRLVPGVVGNGASVVDESFAEGLLEYPQFTRPAVFRDWSVPDVLLSGDHERVNRWRHAAALARTMARRPDLIAARGGLTDDEARLLVEHGYPL